MPVALRECDRYRLILPVIHELLPLLPHAVHRSRGMRTAMTACLPTRRASSQRSMNLLWTHALHLPPSTYHSSSWLSVILSASYDLKTAAASALAAAGTPGAVDPEHAPHSSDVDR